MLCSFCDQAGPWVFWQSMTLCGSQTASNPTKSDKSTQVTHECNEFNEFFIIALIPPNSQSHPIGEFAPPKPSSYFHIHNSEHCCKAQSRHQPTSRGLLSCPGRLCVEVLTQSLDFPAFHSTNLLRSYSWATSLKISRRLAFCERE